jgi:hypothetical protein
MSDWCSSLRNQIDADLTEAGLVQVDCRTFGQGSRKEEEVCFFRGHGKLIAIPYSIRSGITCFVGPDGAAPATYASWPVLWPMVGMGLANDQDLGNFLEQFPEDDDGMVALIGAKLRELFCK